jgi:hypothetical protein
MNTNQTNKMVNIYLIIGYNNVSAWHDNELDQINLDNVFHEAFYNEKEKQIFTQALYLLDNNMHGMSGNYTFLNEDEYKLLTT